MRDASRIKGQTTGVLFRGLLGFEIMNCSFRSEESPCSLGGPGSVILPLLARNRDMIFHLVSLGISGKRGREKRQRIAANFKSCWSAGCWC